jgi:signal peptide peptidase SppA
MINLKYPNIAGAFYNIPWAITPEKLYEIEAFISRVVVGEEIALEEKEALVQDSILPTGDHSEAPEEPSIGLVPILGSMTNRSSLFSMASGGTSYQSIAGQLFALADDERVSHILLDIDSPGGVVNGISFASEAIRYAKSKKPVIAVINDQATSAAYWLASQANEIVGTRTSTVGSIGVLMVHSDWSEFDAKKGVKNTVIKAGEKKALGNEYEPLSKEARDEIQAHLDGIHSTFIQSVASGRGISEDQVRAIATGEIWTGEEAIENGLVDRTGTLRTVIEGIEAQQAATQSTASANAEGLVLTVGDSGISGEITEDLTHWTGESPEPQQTEEDEMSDELIKGLTEQVQTLTNLVTSMQGDRAKERAESLVDSYVSQGTVAPAARDELVAQATDNYETVAKILSSLPKGGGVPVNQSVVDPNNGRTITTDSNKNVALTMAEKSVFGAMGALNPDGTVNFDSFTMKMDGAGRIVH